MSEDAPVPSTRRGRLKVFLGAAPGVGKTWGMLDDAARAARGGTDVLVAVVETHGRAETEDKLRDLPVLPRRAVPYKGHVLHEMDLDALLARRPGLALIDELAHTNAEGSRHEKRWQDVEEVLDAGIDVYTAVNVQHLETLNDAVARITGVRVRETVPDRLLAAADEIELIDIPPEELLERLREGKVYIPEQAARATQNFFGKGNLTALRELALRAAADQVDAQLRSHMERHAIPGPWPAAERILVVVDDDAGSRDAVRVAKRAADRSHSEWIALSLTGADGRDEGTRDRVASVLRLAERLGAEVETIDAGPDPAREVIDLARRRNVRRIVLGRPARSGWLGRWGGDALARDLLRHGADFEIVLAPAPEARPQRRTGLAAWWPRWPPVPRGWKPWSLAILAVALASAVSVAIDRVFPVTSLSLVYMTAVIAVAARAGMGPALATAGLGFLTYNFLFTEPRFTFEVSRQGELLTLLLFVVASVLTGNLAARLRERVLAQRDVVDRTNKLYGFARRVAGAATLDNVIWGAVSHVHQTLGCQSVLLMPNEAGVLAVVGAFPPEDHLPVRDMTAAAWAWDKGEAAGRGSDTLPTALWFVLPVRTRDRTLAVLGVKREDGRELPPTDLRLLALLADQVALALERVRLAQELQAAHVASETDRLRTALLSSVSHDLRTPLVTIIGAAGTLAEAPGLSDASRLTLAETIREEGERLDRYVQNLLDMTRLGHGALRPRLVAVDLSDLIGAARRRLRGPLRDRSVEVAIPPDLAPALADGVLTEQVLVNILDNAAKYAPEGTPVRVAARAEGAMVVLEVSDEGPGIPEAERERVFDMFHRVEAGDRHQAGTGLGLAICRGLVEAQGGTVRIEEAPGGGTRVVVALPLAPVAAA